jgi:hypothetical protein
VHVHNLSTAACRHCQLHIQYYAITYAAWLRGWLGLSS